MNKQQKIIKLEKETKENNIEIRKIQDKKWFCLQLLKRMVK